MDRSREVCEWEGYECTRESIWATSMLRLIHRTVLLARMLPSLTCLHKFRFTVDQGLKVTPPCRGRLPRNQTGVWNRSVTSHSRLVSTRLIVSDEFSMVIIVEKIGDLLFGQKTDIIHLI